MSIKQDIDLDGASTADYLTADLNPLSRFDIDLTLTINEWNSSFWDPIMYQVSNKYVWFALGAVLIAWLFRSASPNYKKALIFLAFVAVMALVTDQLCNLFKHTVQRLRPCHDPLISDLVHIVNGDKGGRYGFFSAHAAIFFGLATMTSKFFKRNWFTVLIFAIAVIVSYSRIYLGRHYVGDVACGAIAGTAIGYLAYHFYRKMQHRLNFRHKRRTKSKSPKA